MKDYQLKKGDLVKMEEHIFEFIKYDGMYGKWIVYDKIGKNIINTWETFRIKDDLVKQGKFYIPKSEKGKTNNT